MSQNSKSGLRQSHQNDSNDVVIMDYMKPTKIMVKNRNSVNDKSKKKYILSENIDTCHLNLDCKIKNYDGTFFTNPNNPENNEVFPNCCLIEYHDQSQTVHDELDKQDGQDKQDKQDEINNQNLAASIGNSSVDIETDSQELANAFKPINWNVSNGGMSKSQYKAYLSKLSVKKLYKMAKDKGIKITKKRNNKTLYIKKDTIVKKLCDSRA
jgi:hypothetical protein